MQRQVPNFHFPVSSFGFYPIRDLCRSVKIILLILNTLVALFLNSRFGIPHFLSLRSAAGTPQRSRRIVTCDVPPGQLSA